MDQPHLIPDDTLKEIAQGAQATLEIGSGYDSPSCLNLQKQGKEKRGEKRKRESKKLKIKS